MRLWSKLKEPDPHMSSARSIVGGVTTDTEMTMMGDSKMSKM